MTECNYVTQSALLLLARWQSLELTRTTLVLKDIFFRSHPLEYSWAQSREDYKDLTFQFLLEFVRRTDECRKDALAATLCDRLNYWYGALSRHVHVHSACFMGYRSAGTRYRPDASHLTKLDERTAETWPILTLMLILFNPERYQRASLVERRLIQYSIPKHHLKEMRL